MGIESSDWVREGYFDYWRGSRSKLFTGVGIKQYARAGHRTDIAVPDQSHLETANQASKSGLFGGVGWYEEGYRGPNGEEPHTHVDMRGSGKARWGHPKKGAAMHGYFPSYEVQLNKSNCSCSRD